MPERLHPGVYVEEVKPAVRAIEGVSTSTLAAIGVAERGPISTPKLVTSFDEYGRFFGGYRTDSFLTYAVQHFFDNGGKKCYVVRVVGAGHQTASLDLRDRERVEAGPGASEGERILAETLPGALAEAALRIRASSPGVWGNLIDVQVENGTRDPENEFKLLVRFREELVETWDNLSMNLGDENFVENLLGADQSQYIRVSRLPTASSDVPAVVLSGVLDANARTLAALPDTPILSITIGGTIVSKIVLDKANKDSADKVAAEIQKKVRTAALPAGTDAKTKEAFEKFECRYVESPRPRYVLIAGAELEPRTMAVPPATAGPGETDVQGRLKLNVAAAGTDKAYAIDGKGLQRGRSRSGNAPAIQTNGKRNLSFNLNSDGFQTVTLDSGLNGGDAVATDIRNKVRAKSTARKDPANESAYTGLDATYTARYLLMFGSPPADAGTFTFAASQNAPKDFSTDARLRLRAAGPAGAETLYGGSTAGPLAVNAGSTDRERTIASGSAPGTRPVEKLDTITDGELRLVVTPPGQAAINVDLTFPGPGPGSGEEIAAAIQAAVRAKAREATFGTLPNVRAALENFTARYEAYYTLVSGAVRLTDAGGNPIGPLSSVRVLPALADDIAPDLKLGVVNGGTEQTGAAMLRPPMDEYHVGDHTLGGAVYAVTAGADGAQPADTDYTGPNGLRALDKTTDVNLIIIPGIGSKQVVSAGFGYCVDRPLLDCFFIADLGGSPPADTTFRSDVPFVTDVPGARNYVRGLPTKNDFGAIYFPWLEAPDPIGRGRNPRRTLPPSGYVAGMYARIDSRRGVFKAPAGTEANLTGPLVLAAQISDTEQDFLNPIGVNVIRSFPASGFVIWGARTLSSDAAWRYVSVRRMAIFLRVSIYNGIQYAVFEPNDDDLWASLRLTIGSFMLTQFRAGAFQGNSPDKAFFVKCDGTTTTQADIDNGVVNILVGFAPLKPAEFVVLKLSQKAGQAPS